MFDLQLRGWRLAGPCGACVRLTRFEAEDAKDGIHTSYFTPARNLDNHFDYQNTVSEHVLMKIPLCRVRCYEGSL